MKCHLLSSVLLVVLSGCSAGEPVAGAILSQPLRELEGKTAEAVELFVVAPGATQELSVRVTWAFEVDQADSDSPFGNVEVVVEKNEIRASTVTCATGDPELSTLLNGDRVWMLPLACAYEAEGQSGTDISAELWANGLLTRS